MVLPSPLPDDIRDAWHQAGPRLGPFASGLRYLPTVTSTNDVTLRLADAGAEEGTTLVAGEQTAGRGRRGRQWLSPPGAGLYCSILLRPSASSGVASTDPQADWIAARLTVTAGVALAEGVRAGTGLLVELKWPNDLVVAHRKLGGILAEMATNVATRPAVVIGMGINLRPAVYPLALSHAVTSIEAELGRPVDRALVLVEVLAAMAARYHDLSAGRFDAILSGWRRHARSLPGSPIEWDGPDGVVRGEAVDIDTDGALVARAGGALTRLVAGEVRWR